MHVTVILQGCHLLKRNLYVCNLNLTPVVKRLVEPVNIQWLICVILQNTSLSNIAKGLLLSRDNRKEVAYHALVQLTPQASHEQICVKLPETG